MNFEQQSYEIEELWSPEQIAAMDRARIAELAGWIPASVTSLLDAGCGGGIYVNHLQASGRRFMRLCGVDRSAAALKHVKVESQLANIDRLPFQNREFQAVSCLEVLEHLPLNVYAAALTELSRVAGDYLIVSVPYNQDLDQSLVRCEACATRFNPDYHMRSFDKDRMQVLFANYGFSCVRLELIGERTEFRGARLIEIALSRNIPGPHVAPWYSVCPMCGNKGSADSKPIHRSESVLKRTIKRIWPKSKSYRWVAALYKRSR